MVYFTILAVIFVIYKIGYFCQSSNTEEADKDLRKNLYE